MDRLRIGLLNKRRGNFALQEKFVGARAVVDRTDTEVEHHRHALTEAGYAVCLISWGPGFISALENSRADLIFNVSSMAEAAILEELEIPYVGSDTFTIAVATDKSLVKRLWHQAGLPTSPFFVARTVNDCEAFSESPPFEYPLFIKPVAGRGSAGIDETSIVETYEQLTTGVARRLDSIGQPILIERFLQGREITLGILGNGENARVLPPLEIAYHEGDLTLTFDKKELDDDTFLCPARLTEAEAEMMEDLALRAYRTLGFRDYGRIDTMLTKEGPVLLEGNTFPGLMCTPTERPHSYIGFMARVADKDGTGLLDEIVQVAVTRLGLRP